MSRESHRALYFQEQMLNREIMSNGRIHLFSKRLFQSSAPFSHVVIAGGVGHVSGIIGQRRDTGALVGHDTAAQAQAMFDNLETALAEAGSERVNDFETAGV